MSSQPSGVPTETLQTANKVVHAVRDVKAAATSSGSFFDRAIATAAAALNLVPKPDEKTKKTDDSSQKKDSVPTADQNE